MKNDGKSRGMKINEHAINLSADKYLNESFNYAIIHEMAHSLAKKCLGLENYPILTSNNDAKKWINFSWSKQSELKWKKKKKLSCQPFRSGKISQFQGLEKLNPPDMQAIESGFCSAYGSQNPSEDFAEAVTFYILKKQENSIDGIINGDKDTFPEEFTSKLKFVDEIFKKNNC